MSHKHTICEEGYTIEQCRCPGPITAVLPCPGGEHATHQHSKYRYEAKPGPAILIEETVTSPKAETSPLPWSISDSHGLCIVDANSRMVTDLTPSNSWLASSVPSRDTLRANAELIVQLVNGSVR